MSTGKDKLFDFMHSEEMGNAGDQIGSVLKGIGKLLFSEEDPLTGRPSAGVSRDANGDIVTTGTTIHEAPPSKFAECIHGASCAGYRGDARCDVYSAASGPETVREGAKKEARVPSAPSSDAPPVAGSRFCDQCGVSVFKATAKFCPRCGEKL